MLVHVGQHNARLTHRLQLRPSHNEALICHFVVPLFPSASVWRPIAFKRPRGKCERKPSLVM